MSTAPTIDDPGTLERVLERARSMMRVKRLPRMIREQLTVWARGRVDRGAPVEVLEDLVVGTSDLHQADGVVVADATGDSEVLEGTVPEIAAVVAQGDLDAKLEYVREAEVHHDGRVGVLRAIDQRRVHRDAERLVAGTIAALIDELASGAWDEHLDLVRDAEQASKDRIGARKAIEHRQEVVAALEVLDGTVSELRDWLASHPDAPVEAMLHAERDGKARKTALAALERATRAVAAA